MTGYTEGPWRADGPDGFGDFNILHDANALAVAAVISNMRQPSEIEANARLISAAPDMYEAHVENVRQLVMLLSELQGRVEASKLQVIQTVLQRSHDAYSKAEGKA